MIRTLYCSLFLLAGLVLAWPAAADTQPSEAERITLLVLQLGSSQYAEREEASKALERIGAPALESLRRAAQSKDPEIRRRAERLVQLIEKRLDEAKLLAPQRVRLVYQDTPLADAVADIAKKTGYTIKVAGDLKSKLTERKVTLDTGETLFWDALDQFCAKAGLVVTAPAPAPDKNKALGGSGSVIMINGGGGAPVVPRDVMKPEKPDTPDVLVLVDGTPRTLPTHYAGNLRIIAQPPGTPVTGQKKTAGEALLALEVTSEPSLRWQRPVGLRITKAIDDNDQALQPLLVSFGKPTTEKPKGNVTVIVNGVPVNPEGSAPEGVQRQVPVRLRLGEKPSKVLKELSGTIAAQVQSPIQTLVTVDNILKTADQTVSGPEGCFVKVLEATRQDNGQVRLRFVVEAPPRGLDDGSTVQTSGVVVINGKVMGQNEEPLSALNFTLFDDKGRPFQTAKAINTGRKAGTAQEFDFFYQPAEGQGEPAKFVYTGRRTVILDVPFTLKDVPLQ